MTTTVEIYEDSSVLEIHQAITPSILQVITPGPQGPKGPPGTITGLITAEVPSGAINGVNMDFTTANPFQIIWVYLNGLRMDPGADYTVTGSNSFSFTYAPTTGDTMIVDYAIP